MPARSHSRPRGHARFFRSLQFRTTASKPIRYAAAAADPSPTAIFKPPSSVIAVASVTSVIGALLIISLGIGLWKYRTRRRRNERAPVLVNESINEKAHVAEKHIDLDNVAIYMEKPERALLVSDLSHSHAGWVPQIRSQHGSGRTLTAKNKPKSRPLQATVAPPSEDSSNLGKEQPPSNPIAPVIHILSPPILSATNLPTPPNPPITRKSQTNVTSVSMEVTQAPTPSPRFESVVQHGFVMLNHGRDEPWDGFDEDQNSRLPRLMTVVTAFTPNLTDELSIEIGEPVRMLDEYRDGWCLVQRVTKSDAPKGVVPRFCLHERRMLPIAPAQTNLSEEVGLN